MSTFLRQYVRYYRSVYALMAVVLFACYWLGIARGAGGDLALRISEAKYFLNGINPYDVFSGRAPPIEAYGDPHAYSPFSYLLASSFTIFDLDVWQNVTFAALDIMCLMGGIALTTRMVGHDRSLAGPFIIAALLCSVFLWQHIWTLNYNLLAAFGLIVSFYGIHRNRRLLCVVGMVIVGVKPSLAIPLFLYLLVSRRWRLLVYGGSAYALALVGVACWIKTTPLAFLLQLIDTQSRLSRLSGGYTDGFLYFLKPYVHEWVTLVAVLIAIVILFLARKWLKDPVCGLMLVICLGIGLFYNHVHAWIIAYPLIVYAVTQLCDAKASTVLVIAPLLFILLPRLAGQFSAEARDVYVMIHNVMRFGLLFVACSSVVRCQARRETANGVLAAAIATDPGTQALRLGCEQEVV